MWLFILALAFSIGINVVMFIPAFIYKTDQLTDISYSLTFIFLATFGLLLSNKKPIHVLLFGLVCLWAIRLGSFLFMRIRNMKVDKRFDGRREYFGKFLSFWLLQGVTVPIVLTSSLLAFSSSGSPSINWITIIGIAIFLLGLRIETIADTQKYQFNQTNHPKTWIDTGIWRSSRHPNYLGEMLVWIGLYFVAFTALPGADKLVGLISPLYIIGLLVFVSGIPLLEKTAEGKWGTDKNYQAYKNSVPLLIPTLASIKRIGQQPPVANQLTESHK